MKKVIPAFLLCVLLLVSGCDASIKNDMYDDDSKIASDGDSYLAIKSIGYLDGNEYSLSATITGTETVWRYNAESGCDVEFSFSLDVASGGKAKLVLITPDNEVITLAENTDNDTDTAMQTQTISLKQGKNRIKIVGYDSPKLELRLGAKAGRLGTD